MQHPEDGKAIVVQNGQRASETMSQEQALAEAKKRQQKLSEAQAQGQQVPVVEVKTNLYG